MRDGERGAVSPTHEKANQIERGAQGLALKDAQKKRQAAGVGEEHFAESEIAGSCAGVGEAHVEFDEEVHGRAEVVVGPELRVVSQGRAALRVADVEREPDFLESQTEVLGREEESFALETANDSVHDALAMHDHAQPGESRHPARLMGDSTERTHHGISNAQVLVAAKGENPRRLGRAALGLAADHGGEAGVDDFVEIDRDGVQGNEVVHVEVPH